MRCRCAILLLAWFLPCLAARAEEPVIQPRAPVPAAVPVAGRAPGAGLPLLPVAAVFAAAGGWLLWRHRRGPGGSGARVERHLTIAETRPLGNRQHLVVADYAGSKFLLGVCPGRIDLLARLDADQPPPAT
jgi:flagellar protein FliO/FliZ